MTPKRPEATCLIAEFFESPFGSRLVALRIFAAFAGVALAADAVHRDGERFVRFLADRAVRHRAGLEALHDALDRLDFLDRNRHRAVLEVEQAAQRAEVRRLVVDQARVFLEDLEVAVAHGLLQPVDRFGIEQVELAVRAPLILAADRQRVTVDAAIRERGAVAHQHFLRDHVHADAADARGGPGEVFVDDVLTQTDRFENLRAAIALDRGDAHLRHDLDDALGRGLDEVLARRLVIDVRQAVIADHAVDRFERDVRIDGAHAVADQQSEVMHFARLTGFEHEAHARAQTFADQIVMQARDCEQRRDRREFAIHAAIGEDEDVHFLLFDHAARHQTNLFHRLDEALLAASHPEQRRQHADLEARQIHAANLRELLVREDRPLHLEAATVRRLRIQQVAFGTETRFRRSDDLLADAIDRRVGDLREELLEVVVEQPRLVRQHGERRVVAHRADRLDAVCGHRREQQALIFEGVAERDLPLQQRVVIRCRHFGCGRQIVQMHQMIIEPLAIRAFAARSRA